MGLTVGCARCHNHKFDPIPQKDYYRHPVDLRADDAKWTIRWRRRPKSRPTARRRSASTALQRPLREEKTKIEAPYLQMILDREIAKLPEYMQLAWKTPPDQRTPGQKLNVTQIETHRDAGRHDAQARHRKRPRRADAGRRQGEARRGQGADRGARQAEAAAAADGAGDRRARPRAAADVSSCIAAARIRRDRR